MTPGHPQYMAPPRPQRPASRLVAGVLWLVAAGLAVGATFGEILIERIGNGTEFIVGFWRQALRVDGREEPAGTIYYGAEVVAGAAILLLATLLVLLSRRRWAAVVAGAFGTGMMLTSGFTWFLTTLNVGQRSSPQLELGFWLLTGAVAAALVAFLLSLLERARPVRQPMFAPQHPRPPQPPLPPRWEPQTPKYGVPVQRPPAQQQSAQQQPAPEPTITTHLDAPEPTSAIDPPPAPEPGSISRKLDGDEK